MGILGQFAGGLGVVSNKAWKGAKWGGGLLGGFALSEWGTLGGRLRGLLDNTVPTFENAVTCTVYGSGRSSMNDLLGCALATCFGQVSLTNYASSNEITIEIDRTNKRVKATLSYTSSGLNAAVNALSTVGGSLFGNPSKFTDSAKKVILNGVPSEVVGGGLPPWLQSVSGPSIQLPLTGQVVATNNPSSPNANNYVPFQDGVSRDGDLTQIITAALMNDQCSSPGETVLTRVKRTPTSQQELVSRVSPLSSTYLQGRRIPFTTLIGVGGKAVEVGGVDSTRWTILTGQKPSVTMPEWDPPSPYEVK